MKPYLTIVFVIAFTTNLWAQSIGIGTSAPDSSSALEVHSTKQGFLTPRITTAQRDSILNPVPGLLIFNTTKSAFEYLDSSRLWVSIMKNNSTATTSNDTPSKKLAVIYTDKNAYGFYFNSNGVGIWSSQSLNGSGYYGSSGNNMIVLYNGSKAYGFNQTPGMNAEWTVGPDYSTDNLYASFSSSKCIIVIANKSVHVFYRKSNSAAGFWSSQSLSGTFSFSAFDNFNDGFLIYTTTNAYVFYQDASENGIWEVIPINLSGNSGSVFSD